MNDTYAPDLGEEFDLKLNIPYTVCEILVAIFAVIGNAMVIIVFQRERRLRRRTNYYIVSLASADFLVGLLGIPFAILASVGLPVNIYACLFTVSLLVVLCTISIFCLVAVSVDRYWAILHPMGYSRNVRTKTALVIISICWIAGSFVGFLPLFGWHAGEDINQKCFFVRVMDYNYLVFLYFATIITPAILLAGFYAHIYRVVLKQLRRMVSANPSARTNGQIRIHGGKMLRMLGAAQKREVKATQNLSIIVLFFMICWIPLYTINCVQAFCSSCQIGQTFTDFCIILSHLNSAVNPLLYAYHLRDFRAALKHLIYNIFGIKDKSPSELDRNCRPSVNSNCSQYNRRPYLRNQPSTESLILYRNKIARNSLDASKKASVCLPIVSGTAMVAAASAGETGNREMWMIKEIPSASASAASEINGEREISIFPDGYPSVNQDISSESSSSGNINSGYVEGIIDDLEMGEDDVFYADASTFSANDYESDTSGILRKSDKNSDSIPTKKASKIWCLSSSSPQLSRSIFVVDNNVNNIKSSTTDKPLTIVDRKRPNLSVSGEFSPAKNLKLSPMRVVGEFLLHHNSNKCSKIYKKDEHSENNTNSVMIPDEEIKNNI